MSFFDRQRVILAATIAFAIGAAASAFVGVYEATGRPGVLEIRGVETTHLEDGGYELAVTLHGPPVPQCLRVSEHFLYQYDPNGGLANGIPLATTITGPELPPQPTDYKLHLKIHPDTAYGKWNYEMRSVFVCSAFPGLMRLEEWESKPYPIQLDERD